MMISSYSLCEIRLRITKLIQLTNSQQTLVDRMAVKGHRTVREQRRPKIPRLPLEADGRLPGDMRNRFPGRHIQELPQGV